MTSQRKSIVPGTLDVYPVLPLRDIVVFPHMIVPLFVGREKSIRALEEVMKSDKPILLATQKNAADDDPAPDAIFSAGTLASVLQLLKLPDGTVKVLVEGSVARGGDALHSGRRLLPGRGPGDRRRADRKDRGRGAVALGGLRVRKLREAQQEDFARGGRARSIRSTTTASSPTPSPRISPSSSATSRRSSRCARSPSASRSAWR